MRARHACNSYKCITRLIVTGTGHCYAGWAWSFTNFVHSVGTARKTPPQSWCAQAKHYLVAPVLLGSNTHTHTHMHAYMLYASYFLGNSTYAVGNTGGGRVGPVHMHSAHHTQYLQNCRLHRKRTPALIA